METTSSEKNKNSKSYFAFFDLDHTITRSVSGKELVLGAFKKGLMSRTDLVSAIYLSMVYKMNLVNPSEAIDKMGTWVKGINVGTMENLCSEVFKEVLLPSLFPEAKNEILLHKEKDAGLIILSSSLSPICHSMAEYLEMDDILCSGLESVNGVLTGKATGKFCFGEEKAERLRQYCELNNSKLKDAWYYGDAFTDLPALSIVGHPVCINPERKLERVAKKKGWKIFYWKK